MALSNDLISQFVRITKDKETRKKESTAYGTITPDSGGNLFVKLDGSDLLTPYDKLSNVKTGDRVKVFIKNHSATIDGNYSEPSMTMTSCVSDLSVNSAFIGNLTADNAFITNLEASFARIDVAHISDAFIKNLVTDTASIEELNAKYAKIDFANISDATIKNLVTNTASINELNARYANIDFANIDEATIKNLAAESAFISGLTANTAFITKMFADTGIIENAVISQGHVTGRLGAVTVQGDNIEAGTLKADRLIIRGDDGLYYQLNQNGVGSRLATDLLDDGTDREVKSNWELSSTSTAVYSFEMSETNSIENRMMVVPRITISALPDPEQGNWMHIKTPSPIARSELANKEEAVDYTISYYVYTSATGLKVYPRVCNSDGSSKMISFGSSGEIPRGKWVQIVTTSQNNINVSDETQELQFGFTIDSLDGPRVLWIASPKMVQGDASSLQTIYNSISGKNIVAKSITANEIAVDDLYAFDATIGGFELTSSSINSMGKGSIDSENPGIYMDSDGQFIVGDIDNHVKYYMDANGNRVLEIQADSIKLMTGDEYTDVGSLISQTEENIRFEFDQYAPLETVNNIQNEVTSNYSEFENLSGNIISYFDFSPTDGFVIGNTSSNFKTKYTNTKISFMNKQKELAWIEKELMYIRNAQFTEGISFGAKSNGDPRWEFEIDEYGLGIVYKG